METAHQIYAAMQLLADDPPDHGDEVVHRVQEAIVTVVLEVVAGATEGIDANIAAANIAGIEAVAATYPGDLIAEPCDKCGMPYPDSHYLGCPIPENDTTVTITELTDALKQSLTREQLGLLWDILDDGAEGCDMLSDRLYENGSNESGLDMAERFKRIVAVASDIERWIHAPSVRDSQ